MKQAQIDATLVDFRAAISAAKEVDAPFTLATCGWSPAEGAAGQASDEPTAEGPVGGKYARFPNSPMADTEEDAIYQSVRYDVGDYHLNVPNGKYTVALKFCEPAYAERRRRVFDTKLQGKLVIDELAPTDYQATCELRHLPV